MTAEWAPDQYKDTYGDHLHELIERKRKEETITREVAEVEPTKVVDLMDALRASVEKAEKARTAAASTKDDEEPKAAKKAPAKSGKRKAS
jgi:DNA end-binding protein Ku